MAWRFKNMASTRFKAEFDCVASDAQKCQSALALVKGTTYNSGKNGNA